jgi:two-component system sensor histidine kinase KdpD
VVLFDRRTGLFYRSGPADFDGLDDQLRESALLGTSFAGPAGSRTITAVHLGAEPIAALALQGAPMPDSVLQGIANLVAIGLERARSQDLAAQVEAARESERLRTTLLDAMAHEFKTPLTSVIGATTALLDTPEQPAATRTELLRIADEEAHHLQDLIEDTVEMARLDNAEIQLNLEPVDLSELVQDVTASMRAAIDNREVVIAAAEHPPAAADRRLVKLALKQLLDNALKYSPPSTPVHIGIERQDAAVSVSIANQGPGIPAQELSRIFDRMYRSPSVERRIPGSGLGLSIAQSIARAHGGDLEVTSRPGATTFQFTLPKTQEAN